MMQRVGRHDVPDLAECVDAGLHLLGQPDRRPDEKGTVRQPDDGHPGRIVKPGDRKVRSPGNPDVVAKLLQYRHSR
ncbi:hypothetical protein ACVWZM_000650 [Bradyrhizobium sp. USDA 4501]